MSLMVITRPLGVLALIAPALVACAIDERDTGVAEDHVAVEPRVIMDGLQALGSRPERIVVDQVMFHAPAVDLMDQRRIVADVLASDQQNRDPLLFRYDVSSDDGFGNVLGGERHWQLETSSGDLVFGFRSFDADERQLGRLQSETDVDLHELSGHTAVVHGFVFTRAATSDGSSSGFSNPCEGDPDGNPADCSGTVANGGNTSGDGDPDGNPAKNGKASKSGQTAEGDPDGNPATSHPGGSRSKVAAGDGDPDGNPSSGTDGTSGGLQVDRALTTGSAGSLPDASGFVRTPFFVVLNDAFSLRIPVGSLAQDVNAGEVLPINLHVALDQLLSDDVIHSVSQQATDPVLGAAVVEAPAPQGALHVDVSGATTVHVGTQVHAGTISVVGDRR